MIWEVTAPTTLFCALTRKGGKEYCLEITPLPDDPTRYVASVHRNDVLFKRSIEELEGKIEDGYIEKCQKWAEELLSSPMELLNGGLQ